MCPHISPEMKGKLSLVLSVLQLGNLIVGRLGWAVTLKLDSFSYTMSCNILHSVLKFALYLCLRHSCSELGLRATP